MLIDVNMILYFLCYFGVEWYVKIFIRLIIDVDIDNY